jgi:hypothetical protein
MIQCGLVTEICRIRDGKMVWYQRYAGPGMVHWSGNKDMQDQGGYSGMVTQIFRTKDGTVIW